MNGNCRIGAVLLAALEPNHIRQLYVGLERDHVSATQRRKIGTTLGTALRQVGRQRLLRFNPSSEIPKPRAIRPETQVFTPEQVRRFLEAAKDDPLYALYVVALDTGRVNPARRSTTWSHAIPHGDSRARKASSSASRPAPRWPRPCRSRKRRAMATCSSRCCPIPANATCRRS